MTKPEQDEKFRRIDRTPMNEMLEKLRSDMSLSGGEPAKEPETPDGMPDPASIPLWARLNREGRWPCVQYGPTENDGEPLWCVSLVNPHTGDFFAHKLSEALSYAEGESNRLRRDENSRRLNAYCGRQM